MFKAIGRWGSQVKNTLSVHIFSNIFSSKSKKYGDLNNDEEEIFCDAQEEISDSESEHEEVPTTSVETNGDISVVKADINWNIETAVSSDAVKTESAPVLTTAEASDDKTEETCEVDGNTEDLVTFDVDLSGETETEKDVMTTKDEGKAESGKESSSESEDDDDHHDNHSDKKKIMKNSKSSNGLVQSASATVIRKVHRRMNSYSQRQYAKFESAQDDENDNVIQNDVTTSNDDVDNNSSTDNIDQIDSKSAKKTKRKKKVPFFHFFRGIFSFGSRSKSTRVR